MMMMMSGGSTPREAPQTGQGDRRLSLAEPLPAQGRSALHAYSELPGSSAQDGGAQALNEGRKMLLALLRGGGAALRVGSRLGLDVAAASMSPLLQTARDYARPVRKKKQGIPSHLDDLPPTMLKKDYANLPVVDKLDDVVRRMLSLEMASQKEKVKIKREQLADKVRSTPNDTGSFEVQVAHLTARIRTLREHLHIHPKDKSNKRCMLMTIDRRRMLLKNLRNSRYDVFENTCKQLGIEYDPPPQYRRRATKRWIAKKALCIRVFQEAQKLKAPERLRQRQEWQQRALAAKEQALQNEGTPV
ncbi:small ribosomal subunit protein uS15m [Elgaria multicarinata webbii]|uniref:small ribosomal subunit protein uS15m n=1 Tax=Elgaria multicarinata webbii TaxID=159646 RepID=UPI002FCD5FB8